MEGTTNTPAHLGEVCREGRGGFNPGPGHRAQGDRRGFPAGAPAGACLLWLLQLRGHAGRLGLRPAPRPRLSKWVFPPYPQEVFLAPESPQGAAGTWTSPLCLPRLLRKFKARLAAPATPSDGPILSAGLLVPRVWKPLHRSPADRGARDGQALPSWRQRSLCYKEQS